MPIGEHERAMLGLLAAGPMCLIDLMDEVTTGGRLDFRVAAHMAHDLEDSGLIRRRPGGPPLELELTEDGRQAMEDATATPRPEGIDPGLARMRPSRIDLACQPGWTVGRNAREALVIAREYLCTVCLSIDRTTSVLIRPEDDPARIEANLARIFAG